MQLMLTPLLAAPVNADNPGSDPLFELCLASALGQPTPDGTSAPIAHHHHCNLCIHGGVAFLAVPPLALTAVAAIASVPIRWAAIDNPSPSSTRVAGNRARGPPLTA